jgi:hypothetical protein
VTDHHLTAAELAANPWASCGPASLAALLGRPLGELRHAFPHQNEGSTWTTLAMMERALARLSVKYERTVPDVEVVSVGGYAANARKWPRHGLVVVQFVGSWSSMPFSHPAQLARTHFIAVKPPAPPPEASSVLRMMSEAARNVGDVLAPEVAASMRASTVVRSMPGEPVSASVFDINLVDDEAAPDMHGWTMRRAWEKHCAPFLASGYGKRATGEWWVRMGLEVAR